MTVSGPNTNKDTYQTIVEWPCSGLLCNYLKTVTQQILDIKVTVQKHIYYCNLSPIEHGRQSHAKSQECIGTALQHLLDNPVLPFLHVCLYWCSIAMWLHISCLATAKILCHITVLGFCILVCTWLYMFFILHQRLIDCHCCHQNL